MAILQNTEKAYILLESGYVYIRLFPLLKLISESPFEPPYLSGLNHDLFLQSIPLVLHKVNGVGRDKSNK